MNAPLHYGWPHRGQQLDRIGPTPDNPPVVYKLNNSGFRCDEFEPGDYLLTLGCSFTFGTGLDYSETWAKLTADRLGLRLANISWPGYSADTCYRLAEYWIPLLQPQAICLLMPPKNRFELLLDPDLSPAAKHLGFEVFLPNSQSQYYSPGDQYIQHWHVNQANSDVNSRRNSQAIRSLAQDLNIPIAQLLADSIVSIDRARDQLHPGPQTNQHIAEQFIQLLKQ